MEVTRANFKTQLPYITEAIQEASFIAVDGEFTGLNQGKGIHGFDTPAERYEKLRKGAMDFLLIQFGISAFKYNSEADNYEEKSFNFYVFPRPHGRQAPDIMFLSQSSSIDFLSNVGFDFNKLFKEGIPFLLPNAEQRLREQLELKHQQLAALSKSFEESCRSPVVIPEEHKPFLEDVCKKIREFLKSKDEVLELESCNAFLRKLIYQHVKTKFSSGIYLETRKQNFNRYIAVLKADQQKKDEMDIEKRKAEMEELEDSVGFSKIIKIITQSGKLVVGHNMLLDVCHILHQFSSSLPEDYEEFKILARCVLPRLVDTKYMASMQPFKEYADMSTLSDLHKSVKKKPFIVPTIVSADESCSYLNSAEQLHEAGYDAYVTGVCFLTMAHYLKDFLTDEVSEMFNSNFLDPFINKLFLMKVQDIPYINLGGDDLQPTREHVFHITFPKEWRTTDVSQLFSPFGSVYIAWIDNTSAFVSLYKPEQARVVMKTLTQSDVYHVQSYQQFVTAKLDSASKHADSVSKQSHKRPLNNSEMSKSRKRKRSGSLENFSDVAMMIEPIPEEDESVTPAKNSIKKKTIPSENSDLGSKESKKIFEESDDWE